MIRSAGPHPPDEFPLDFRVMFEGLAGIHLVLAPDTPRFTMLAATDARLAATLTTREGTIGRPLFDVFSDANPDNDEQSGVSNLRKSLETVLSTGLPHDMAVQRYDLQRPDGAWEVRHWAPRNFPVLGTDGGVRYIVHSVEDVTERERDRAAMVAAERREAELRAVLQSMSDAVYIGGRDGITLANPAALDQLGFATQDDLNRHISTLAESIQTRDARTGRRLLLDEEPFARAVAGERVVQDVLVRHRVLGQDRILRCAAAPVVVDGRVVGAVAVNTDVTDVRRAAADRERLLAESERDRAAAEEARRVAEDANRAKGEFLAVMSHELRTPLNAIGGYTELIEMGLHGPVTEAQSVALARIQRSQRALLSVINEVLNYARLETGTVAYEIASVRVCDVVSDAEALVMPQLRAKGLGYAWTGCDPTLAVRADRDKLQQVLLNLLSNAVKFTDSRHGEPGRVEVSCEAAEQDGQVLLRVRDTGIGIPPERVDAVFDPFVQVDSSLTRTQQGTGLGLAISRGLARRMGGDLLVESTPGRGSVFTLVLAGA